MTNMDDESYETVNQNLFTMINSYMLGLKVLIIGCECSRNVNLPSELLCLRRCILMWWHVLDLIAIPPRCKYCHLYLLLLNTTIAWEEIWDHFHLLLSSAQCPLKILEESSAFIKFTLVTNWTMELQVFVHPCIDVQLHWGSNFSKCLIKDASHESRISRSFSHSKHGLFLKLNKFLNLCRKLNKQIAPFMHGFKKNSTMVYSWLTIIFKDLSFSFQHIMQNIHTKPK